MANIVFSRLTLSVKGPIVRQQYYRCSGFLSDAAKPTNVHHDHHHHAANEPQFLLAHMNYAQLLAPIDDPSMSEFRLAMAPVNQLAQATPGFVWSLDDDGDRHTVPLLAADPLLMPQLSLWTNASSIQHFAFASGHAMYWRRRRQWFATGTRNSYHAVCWWRPADAAEPPTLHEAFARLDILRAKGPTERAFCLNKPFPMPCRSSRHEPLD